MQAPQSEASHIERLLEAGLSPLDPCVAYGTTRTFTPTGQTAPRVVRIRIGHHFRKDQAFAESLLEVKPVRALIRELVDCNYPDPYFVGPVFSPKYFVIGSFNGRWLRQSVYQKHDDHDTRRYFLSLLIREGEGDRKIQWPVSFSTLAAVDHIIEALEMPSDLLAREISRFEERVNAFTETLRTCLQADQIAPRLRVQFEAACCRIERRQPANLNADYFSIPESTL